MARLLGLEQTCAWRAVLARKQIDGVWDLLYAYDDGEDHARYFFSLSAYFSHPSCSNTSTFPRTSCSSFFEYSSIFTLCCGIDVPNILIASRAAFVELPIPTVATGIPLYHNQPHNTAYVLAFGRCCIRNLRRPAHSLLPGRLSLAESFHSLPSRADEPLLLLQQ